MLEEIFGTKNIRYKQVGLFSNNMSAVSWTQRGVAIVFAEAGCLIRVLDLRQQVARASLLVDDNVVGDLNVLGDIPSCSFGYSKQWHCTNHPEFISLINPQLPIPHQRSWQGSRLSFTLSTKVIPELGKKSSPVGECNQLWWMGKSFGSSDVPIENPSELIRTWRK